jgi:hypothetical protein
MSLLMGALDGGAEAFKGIADQLSIISKRLYAIMTRFAVRFAWIRAIVRNYVRTKSDKLTIKLTGFGERHFECNQGM